MKTPKKPLIKPIANIFKQEKISGHKPPEIEDAAKVSSKLFSSASSPACNLCGGKGYWKDRRGTVQTCVECLMAGRMDQ